MNIRRYNHKAIKDYIKRRGITIKKFCELCDISYTQYRRVLDDKDVYASILVKIVVVLKIPFSEIYKIDECDMFEGVELYN